MFKHLDLMIINRSFWPIYPVIGEALLRFAEQQSQILSVGVILQDHANIRSNLKDHGRGNGVKFFPCHAFSVSGSSIIRRVIDAIFFMLWVFFVLLVKRPRKIYVSTDPPVLVPFIVMLYSKLFNACYVYHLQDIHPEATNVVTPVTPLLFRFFRFLDALTIRHASTLITITEDMASEIRRLSRTTSPIRVLPNPSISFEHVDFPIQKCLGFSFCGNAGRLQRIPLLIQAIDTYCIAGGQLPFVFAGAGIFADDLKNLAAKHDNVTYMGVISSQEAAQISTNYQWALLPIEDEVTRFAFPSKSSSYVYSGAYIAAICGESTSVAKWVSYNQLGITVKPTEESLCNFFTAVENNEIDLRNVNKKRHLLMQDLGFEVFIEKLTYLVSPKGNC